jgi:subtilisin family serine protease
MLRTAHRAITGIALAAAACSAGLFTLTGTAFAAPASAEGTVRGLDTPGAIKDNYIVVLKKDATPTAPTALTAKVGGTVQHRFDSAVHGFSAKLSTTGARRLAGDPSVAYVEQDRMVSIQGTQSGPTWGLDRIDQQSLPLNNSYTYGTASNVTAYIIDTGVRLTHNEFASRVTSGYDFVDNDSNASDCHGHGTHVAGTVGGTTYGVTKDVKLVAVRVLNCNGSGSYSQIIAGVDWVTKNAVKPAVANMSLGGSAGSALDDAVSRSIASGVTYAVAAGNEGSDACNVSPARVPTAITVGATDKTDTQADFSNRGTCVDVFAPGVDVVSSANSSNTGTATMSGTSMATPHVTGAAALYLAAHPSATPQQVRDAIVSTAGVNLVNRISANTANKLLNTTKLGTTTPAPTPTPTPAACGPFTNPTDVSIPDRATVFSALTITGCTSRTPTAAKIQVAINHSNRGNLRIDLIAPDGTAYKLKSANSNDRNPNVNDTYTTANTIINRNGTWRLRIEDAVARDTGTLIAWKLTL